VRNAIAKLQYPTNLVHFEVQSQVNKPAVPGIPRYIFTWNYSVNEEQFLQSSITAEVDAGKCELKSLYFYDAGFFNPGQKIDVPLLQPASSLPPSSPLAVPTGESPPPRPILNAIPPRR
jgi:hypothetical protein